MRKTTLEEKSAIACGIEAGKTYEQLAAELHLSKRVVLKWGQHIKKKMRLCALSWAGQSLAHWVVFHRLLERR